MGMNTCQTRKNVKRRRKTHPSFLVAVASFQAAFIGMFLSTGPPTMPYVLFFLIAGAIFNVVSAATMYYADTRKIGVEEKIDEIRSLIGEMTIDSVSSGEIPTTVDEVGVNEGEKVAIIDSQTGKKISGMIIDTHLFFKVSY